MSKQPLFKILREPANLFWALGIALLFFDLQYYLLKMLPVQAEFQCRAPDGIVSIDAIVFSALMSVLVAFFVLLAFELYQKKRRSLKGGGLSGLAFLIGFAASFCTACTLPVISLFGLSFSLLFFEEHQLWFRTLSLALMLVAMLLVNEKAKD